MQLGGSVFLITGGASGLGAATAFMVIAGGGKAVLADVKESEGNALAAELGKAARFIRTDVTDEASGKAAVASALGAFGALHGLGKCPGGNPGMVRLPMSARAAGRSAEGKATLLVPPSASEKRNVSPSALSVPVMKFIGGLPRNPATNRFTGSW